MEGVWQGTGGATGFAVADNGTGMEPEHRDKIFLPFYTTKPEGTGLGLAISLRITEAHGGTLKAENLPSGGVRFVLSLPEAAAETAEMTHG